MWKRESKISFSCSYWVVFFEDSIDLVERKFKALDLLSGFYWIELDQETKHKTYLITQRCHYSTMGLPYVLWNMPIVFQSWISKFIIEISFKYAFIYIEDIHFANFEEYLVHIHDVLGRLDKTSLKLQRKCHYLQHPLSNT